MPGIEHWDSEMACLSRECKATDCSNLVSICMIYPGAIGSGSYCGDNCQYKYWRAHPAAQETEFGMARILLREVGPFQPAETVAAIMLKYGMQNYPSVLYSSVGTKDRYSTWTRVYMYEDGSAIWTLNVMVPKPIATKEVAAIESIPVEIVAGDPFHNSVVDLD